MRSFILFFFILLFIASVFFNCSLYGSIARVPYFGITITEYAEKERDIFMLMYIAGGRLLPQNDKVRDISMSLFQRAYTKTFKGTVKSSEPIGPYETRKTFDLPAALIRLLYWIPPVALALIFIVLLLPRPKPSIEDEKQLNTNY
ncbi:MAG: hypothetical protein JRF02_03250 [Deltaproteobacteria bacterium]|jgi:hypothetical protein|nr:hypothetical protein [Deltaproteobacteria bacterium]